MVAAPPINVFWPELSEVIKDASREVKVDRNKLLSLIYSFLSVWDFDEQWYLNRYPDIKEAVANGYFVSAWEHFRRIGYFEGRMPMPPSVQEDWYITQYSDVAKAAIDGSLGNLPNHFAEHGRLEGRLGEDPRLEPRWYHARYMGPQHDDSLDQCRQHFLEVGYRMGYLPAPPR